MTETSEVRDTSIPINRTHLRAVSLFAASKDIRYYLNGVLVQVTAKAVRLVGTDGHALLIGQTEFETAPDTDVVKMIVPIDVCKRFAADADKTPIFIWPIGAGRYKMESVGLSINFTPVDGTFPDYENVAVLPKSTSGEPCQFDPQLVARAGKAAAIVGSKTHACPVIAYNGQRSSLIHFPTDANLIGVLMPMNLPSMSGLPNWLRPRSAIADLESASGNLPGVDSKDEAAADKPVATAGDAERASATDRKSKRSARKAADEAFAQ